MASVHMGENSRGSCACYQSSCSFRREEFLVAFQIRKVLELLTCLLALLGGLALLAGLALLEGLAVGG